VVDKLAHKISVTDNKRKTVDYKKVLETLRVEYNLSQASIDELVNAHTSVTEYQQLNIGETNAK
jgi:response regulator of citrate/malate metabolism